MTDNRLLMDYQRVSTTYAQIRYIVRTAKNELIAIKRIKKLIERTESKRWTTLSGSK